MRKGESLGLVGESGCGKSTTGRLITRLYDPTVGRDQLRGHATSATLSSRQMLPLRSEIQMIFQDPYSSLNPRHTVGTIVGTPLRVHNMVPGEARSSPGSRSCSRSSASTPSTTTATPTSSPAASGSASASPGRSPCSPKLLVADEPVSALDVSIQAQVVNLLQDVQKEFGIAFLFIAHDLAVVRHFCPEVAVMYLGKIVEIADRETIYEHPHHPYTQALLSAVPDVKQAAIGGRRERIRLEGDVPSPINPPSAAAGSAPAAGWRRRSAPRSGAAAAADRQAAQGRLPLRRRATASSPTSPITAGLLGVDDQGNPIAGADARRGPARPRPGTPTPGST